MMSDSTNIQNMLESISSSLKELAVIESLKVKHSKSELVALIKERGWLVEARTDAIKNKEGDVQVAEATEELDDFDNAYPLIKKYLQFAS